MPLEQTFPSSPANTGIKTLAIGRIIKEALESTWTPAKTSMNILASEIFFEWSNQNLDDKSVPDTRNIVVRVHSGRTLQSDLEIGINTITYRGRPTIHVYALDYKATDAGEGSDLVEDMAQYIRQWVADNATGLQSKGIHSLVGAEENWVPNNADPNWHHWTIQLETEYELRRTTV
jgi:hypothetical protein